MLYTDSKSLLAAIIAKTQGMHNWHANELVSKFNNAKQNNDHWALILVLAKCVKVHTHQARMRWKDVAAVIEIILKNYNMFSQKISDFETLYSQVKKMVANITFARGRLTTYDLALNLGRLLPTPVAPDKYVYLATHTRKTYKFIYGHNPKGYCIERCTIAKDFGNISSVAIENLLCNSHSLFSKVSNGIPVDDAEIINMIQKRMQQSININWCFVEGRLQPYKAHLLAVCPANI